MDDEIDIDEHDILEHPQVKAVFPDLSKIQIHLHSSQVSSIDNVPTEPESGNLLEERLDYSDNDEENNINEDDDFSKSAAQQCANDENENLEENVFVINNVIEETHVISDSEPDEGPQAITGVIDSQQDILEEGNSFDLEHEVNVIQIISKEGLNELQNTANTQLIDETEDEMVVNYGDQEIAEHHEDNLKECHSSIPQLTENVLQISDDEVDGQDLVANCDVLIEDALDNSFRLFEDTPDLNQLIENDSQIANEFIKVPENDSRFIKDIPECYDGFTRENTENNYGTIEEYKEDQYTDIDMAMQDNVDSEYYDEETTLKNTLEDYQQMSIKKEIEFDVEISSDFDETLPEESFNNDELPPEDIYHFKNKIILGSKPSPLVQGDLSTINVKTYLVVVLEDWSVHLSRSQTFCKDCKTLFTTPNALDAHRMTAHSLLAPIVTNRAVKSTALSSANVARKSTANKNITGLGKELSSSTYCNHCNVTFKDHTALIKHLYKLLPVNQYACHFCDATFQTQSDLEKHNTQHIKPEMPRKYLKAKKITDNPILSNMLSVKTDCNSLKRCHPVELKLADKQSVNMKRSVEIKKEPVTNQCRYKCSVCSLVFESYSAARAHRGAHPHVPLTDIIKRLLTKRVSPNTSKDKLTYEDGNKKIKEKKVSSFQLIPMCALFQCSKCHIHLPSSVAAQSHATGTCKYKNIWSCPTCKKTLRRQDKSWHMRQHELSAKLKIYKITKNTYERTLCKCMKCDVHFEYIPLQRHLASCGQLPVGKCKACNILFPKHKLAEHIKKHEIIKLKKKDFILVDYAVVKMKPKKLKSKTRMNPLLAKKIKPKITIKTEPETTKIESKIVNKLKYEREKLKIYFCKHCKCMFMRNWQRYNQIHLSKQCVKRLYASNCRHCGLRVSSKTLNSHEKLHVIRKLTLDDFAFYDFATLNPITPPIPKYPCCKKCKIHFLNRSMIRNHICGEDYDNCEVCGGKFENRALEVHMAIHRMLSATPKGPASLPKIIPELMMKYESLNAIWNILFICGKCELVTDVYNKAVEHSQMHLNKDSQPNTIKCYICNMKFEESCWSKHSELHSRMNINDKDFKILKYMPNNLLDESWFQMFESLPEQEIRQIIDRSVFGGERSLKMRLVKDGLPEFTVHCCSSCHVCYDNNDILTHVKSKCKNSKHVCTDCGVAFDSTATLHFHNLLHNKGIKKEEFRIVHFVKPDHTKTISNFKETLKKTKHVVSKKTEIKVDKNVAKKSEQYVLYKCNECTVCVHMKMNLSYHVCAPDHHLTYCRVCKQHFSFRQMSKHRAKHIKQHDFRAKNIKIISFEPVPDGADKPRYAEKKVSKKSISKSARLNQASMHVQNEQTSLDNSEIEPETSNSPRCSSANSFETPDLKTSKNRPSNVRTTLNSSKHNNTRVSKESSKMDHTDEQKTAKLYKCDCGLHYTSSKSIEQHIETCDSSDDISKEHCSKCGLLFPTDILVSHLCQHHSQETRLCVEPVHKPGRSAAPVHEGIKLYKCSECNVYFLNQSSCYKHISKHVPLDPKEYIECKMCCLQFRILSLHIHMKKHHVREFHLDKVLVEEYQPSVGKQAPRIDIYYANDRCQNVQVSSSND